MTNNLIKSSIGDGEEGNKNAYRVECANYLCIFTFFCTPQLPAITRLLISLSGRTVASPYASQ